ncbi:hypothetical protein [Polaromonas sp. P5_D5]
MKFWQLLSIAGEKLVAEKATTNSLWAHYAIWIGDLPAIVNSQNREKLDANLDFAFVSCVLSEVQQICYFGSDGILRSWRFSPEDKPVSLLSVFNSYGGDILEEILEKGSVKP